MNSEVMQFLLTIISLIGAVASMVFGVARHKKFSLKVSASFLVLVGIIVFIGYLTDSPYVYTYPPTKTGMALPTGICFFITGICLWVLADSVTFKNDKAL